MKAPKPEKKTKPSAIRAIRAGFAEGFFLRGTGSSPFTDYGSP